MTIVIALTLGMFALCALVALKDAVVALVQS